MSTPVGSSQWMYTPASGFYPYLIDQSLRFNDNDSAYLSRTPASAGNRKTWTWSGWVKRGNLASNQALFSAGTTSPNYAALRFISADKIQFFVGGAVTYYISTTAVYRDVSAFYHICFAFDVTETTASDRCKLYVNGVRQTLSGTFPTNSDWEINNNYAHAVGAQSVNAAFNLPYDGYMAEVNFIDGTALDATSFGETINGVWVPKRYSGSYGTNGFYLPFDDSSAIGDDESGNTNDFTATNLAGSDVVPDSPTNNWATFNPLDQNDVSGLTYPTVYSEGNLKLSQATGFINRKATFGMTGGKWYWEIKINDSSPDSFFGVSKSTGDARGALDNDEAMIRLTNGNLYTNAAETSYGTAFSNGDVCMLAVDMDAGKFWAGRNGTWFASGDPAAGTNEGKSGLASELFPSVSLADGENCDVNFGQNGTFNGTKTAGGNSDGNGYGDFLYTVPSSFLALNSANLPEPTISPNAEEQADDYFNTLLYTGDGTTSRSITGVGFAPDFVWGKCRTNAEDNILSDTVRGANKKLESNNTGAEDTSTAATLSGFESDGFTGPSSTPGNINVSGRTYVAWNWKAGGTAVSNTDGSITSSVSAAPDAGFSIVTYASTTGTVGHGLTQAPEAIIMKATNVSDQWTVGHKDLNGGSSPWNYGIPLNTTASTQTNSGFWNNTAPTSTVFSQGSWDSGYNKVAYCFHSVDGFSKVGSYIGNGNADGTFVYTGFRPAWIMQKKSSSAGNNWTIYDTARDTFNVAEDQLRPDISNAEANTTAYDILSNGFKFRSSIGTLNGSGATYIYLAFAEAPFKYANAR